jgi:hypothetical protein
VGDISRTCNIHGEHEYACKIYAENLKGRDLIVDLGGDRMTVLKWTLKVQYVRVWTGFIWFRIATSDAVLNTVMNIRVT